MRRSPSVPGIVGLPGARQVHAVHTHQEAQAACFQVPSDDGTLNIRLAHSPGVRKPAGLASAGAGNPIYSWPPWTRPWNMRISPTTLTAYLGESTWHLYIRMYDCLKPAGRLGPVVQPQHPSTIGNQPAISVASLKRSCVHSIPNELPVSSSWNMQLKIAFWSRRVLRHLSSLLNSSQVCQNQIDRRLLAAVIDCVECIEAC